MYVTRVETSVGIAQQEMEAREQLSDFEQMVFNCFQAAHDHREQIPVASLAVDRLSSVGAVEGTWGVCSHQGDREYMEDRHLAVDTPAYGLWGVLDGHAGELAAERAVEEIPRLLDLIWGLYPPKQAFEELCAALGHQLRDERSGTTLVLSLLDKRTGHLYTATLGDSEAFVWRKETGALEPLSCVRSFDRSPDKERAKRVYQQISTDQLNYVEAWETGLKVARERGDKPKVVSLQQVQRLPLARRATTLMQALLNSTCGLTMPRALGDGEYREFMSIEPDVTITAVGPGDVVLMGSDGVTDYIGALRPWVQEILKTDVEMDRVAQEGVQQALAQGPPGEADNVTLIAIRAERAGGGV